MSKERKGKKVKYYLRNWPKYNASLKQRGRIVFMLTSDISESWLMTESANKLPGGQCVFTDRAIEICLQIRELLKQPLRQTEGFIRGLFKVMRIDLPVPDYTLLSKRALHLKMRIKRFDKNENIPQSGTLRVTVDSTGLKIYGEGEWLKEKHKTKIRRDWRKAHIGINQNGEIIAESLTANTVTDSDELPRLLTQIKGNIGEFLGDGAYDQAPIHMELESKYPSIRIITPPRKDAVLSLTARDHLTQRDGHIMKIEEKGRAAWQAISGYNKRNLVENTIYRHKTIFGSKLKSRTTQNQKAEFTIRCSLLNQMTSLGMPEAYKMRCS